MSHGTTFQEHRPGHPDAPAAAFVQVLEAEQTDRQNEDPQELPDEIARREKLRRKMDEAYAQLEARAQAQQFRVGELVFQSAPRSEERGDMSTRTRRRARKVGGEGGGLRGHHLGPIVAGR
jgi:hypothetical protein